MRIINEAAWSSDSKNYILFILASQGIIYIHELSNFGLILACVRAFREKAMGSLDR